MVATDKRSDRRSRRSGSRKEQDGDDPEAASLLPPAQQSADGQANSEPTAQSSSPLLTRSDASIQEPISSSKPKRRKPRLLSAASLRLPPTRDPASPRHDTPPTARSAVARPRGSTSLWTLMSSCACVGGSLLPPVSATELPSLSVDAENRVKALDTIARSSHIELALRHTDELPLGSTSSSSGYDRPQVIVHVVDVCTGRPLAPRHESKPASFRKQSAQAFDWTNERVNWNSLELIPDFLSSKTLVLLELVQRSRKPTPTNFAAAKLAKRTAKPKLKRVAWCFFKPISDRGNLRLHTLSPADDTAPLRLQLHLWQPLTWLDEHQARSLFPNWNGSNEGSAGSVPTVFLQYQKRAKQRMPTSLHVTVRPVVASHKLQRLAGIIERTADERDVVDATGFVETAGDNQSPPEDLEPAPAIEATAATPTLPNPEPSARDPLQRCKRLPGESCLIPRRVLHRLPTGRNGCSCIAFSLDGLFLAAAVHHVSATADEWVIHVHQINSGVLWQTCRGHQGMIHSLEWGSLNTATKSLVSASSDGSTMLWILQDIRLNATQVVLPQRVWQHVPSPAFVHCATFHTTLPRLVVTGASDGIVRVWDVGDVSTMQPYASVPVYQWKAVDEGGAVYCLCMEPSSGRLFCGDSKGNITVWTASPSTTSFDLVRTVRTGHKSVASVRLHPRKKHLLVLTHPHALLQYELRSFLLLHKNYTGIECDQLLVKANFSADGQFVVSGSEDGVPHLFGSLHGERMDATGGVWGKSFFHGYPILEIAWSTSAHIVALAAFGGNHPIVVLAAYREDRIPEELEDSVPDSHRAYRGLYPDAKDVKGHHQLVPEVVFDSKVDVGNPEQADKIDRRQRRLQQKLAREAAAAIL